MIEFLQAVAEVLVTGVKYIGDAADALRNYKFTDTVVRNYLGYIHYGMGTPLYILFTTAFLIGIGASLWSFIVKGVNWIIDMIPGL